MQFALQQCKLSLLKSRHDKEVKCISRNLPKLFTYCYMLIAASCFIIRTLNCEQIIFFPCRKAIKIRVHFLNLFNIITMQIIGGSMTIFAICKTFLSNTPAFTDGKSIVPQWAVISLYVLQLKGVLLLFRNSCSSVSFHFSISLCC